MYGVDAWGAFCAALDGLSDDEVFAAILAMVGGDESIAKDITDNMNCPAFVGPDADHVGMCLNIWTLKTFPI